MMILTREFMVTSVRLVAAKDGIVMAASMAGKMKTVASDGVHPVHPGDDGDRRGAHASGRNGAVPGWLLACSP